MRSRRLLAGPGDAEPGARGLLPRRGPRVPRSPRGRPRRRLGGPRRPVHGRRRARDRGAGGRRHRARRCLHRLDRRRQHEHRDLPDRPAALWGADRDRAHPRPAAGRVVRAPGHAHRLPDAGRDRHARVGCARRIDPRNARPLRRPGGSRVGGPVRMYIIVVGAGKVGWNLARELLEKNHEVTLIESDRRRYLTVEQELEHNVTYGDASELWVLERAGIQRADMVIAVTGDDEDNMLICQVAKEKYLVNQIIARVNNPRNRQHFDLLGIKPSVSATDLILRLLEHEVPEYGLVHLLDLQEEQLEIIEILLGKDSGVTGRRVGDLQMPEGSLLISVLRSGKGFVPTADTVLEEGDEILAVLDPGKEEDLKVLFGPETNGSNGA